VTDFPYLLRLARIGLPFCSMEGRFSYNFGPFGVAKLVEDEGMLVLVFS